MAKKPPKETLFLPFAGVDTSIHKHLLQAPMVRQLRDMEFDKTGAVNKRDGYSAHVTTGLTNTASMKTVFDHNRQLCIASDDGVQRFSPEENRWKSQFELNPNQFEYITGGMMPCELTTTRTFYQDIRPSKICSAVTTDNRFECVTWASETGEFSWVVINDLSSGQRVVGPKRFDIGRYPMVVTVNDDRFAIVGTDTTAQVLKGVGVDTAVSPVEFGAVATIVTGQELISQFDMHSDPTLGFAGIIGTEAQPGSDSYVYRIEVTAAPPVLSVASQIGPLAGDGPTGRSSNRARTIYYWPNDGQFWCGVMSVLTTTPHVNVFSVDAGVTAAAAAVNVYTDANPDSTNTGAHEITISDRGLASDSLWVGWSGNGVFSSSTPFGASDRGWFRWADLTATGVRVGEIGSWFNSFIVTKAFRPANHVRPVFGIRTPWGADGVLRIENPNTTTPVGALVSPYQENPLAAPLNTITQLGVKYATSAALPAYVAAGAGVGKTLTGAVNGLLEVDGINPTAGDRIIVKNENAGGAHVDHGVYSVTDPGSLASVYILTRVLDFDSSADIVSLSSFYVTLGNLNANSNWYVSTADPITVDVTAFSFTEFDSSYPRVRTIARFQQDALSDADYDTNVLQSNVAEQWNKLCPLVTTSDETFSCYRARSILLDTRYTFDPNDHADYATAIDRIEVRFAEDMLPQKTVKSGTASLLSGGVLWSFDGSNSFETGIHSSPGVIDSVSRVVAGDVNFEAGDYKFRLVFARRDANGDIHRSSPSPVFLLTVPGNTESFVVTFRKPCIPSAIKTNEHRILVEVYMTEKDKEVYHLMHTDDAFAGGHSSDPAMTRVSVTGDEIEVGLAQLLYTSGGILDNIAPPAPIDVTSNLNRVWLISGENQSELWVSKPMVNGLGAEFNGNLTINIPDESERLTAIAALDDKVIAFSETRAYVVSGDGPNAAGQGRFLGPNILSVDVGCVSKNSVVIGPFGIIFQSSKGIYQIDRGLNVTYIGAPVEDFVTDATVINSAVLMSESNQIRFSLVGPGIEQHLVYDYYQEQWSQWFLNSTSFDTIVDTVNHDGLYYMMGNGTEISQETPGVYTDRGNHYGTLVQTAWINSAGVQGFQRMRRAYVLGEHTTGDVRVDIEHDYEEVVTQTSEWTEAEVAALGFRTGIPTAGQPMQVGVHLQNQKNESTRITIQELVIDVGSPPSNGAGVTLSGVGFEIVRKPGLIKQLSPGAKK